MSRMYKREKCNYTQLQEWFMKEMTSLKGTFKLFEKKFLCLSLLILNLLVS